MTSQVKNKVKIILSCRVRRDLSNVVLIFTLRLLLLKIRRGPFGPAPIRTRNSPDPIRARVNAHLRSIMEFGSVVWTGAAKTHVQRLERVQHKILMWLVTHSTKPSQSLDYHHLLSHFGVSCIRIRLVQLDLTFLHSLFPGRIKSADIVGMFGLCAPARRSRGRSILHEPTARVETIRAGMFCRLPRHVNEMYERVADAHLFASRATFMTSQLF